MTPKKSGSLKAWLALALLVSVVLSGCSSLSSQARKTPEPLLPLMNLPEMVAYPAQEREASGFTRNLGSKVRSLVIYESDIREVLKLLFHESDLNLVIDPDVQGMVTLQYQDMPVEAIMESLLKAKGYLYTLQGHTLRIGKRGTRIFTMNLATSGQSNAWSGIESELKKLMTKQGRIVLNAKAGTIMVTDQAENLDRIGTYLDMIEEAMSRQVLVETKIIEVILSDTFQFGVDYSLFADMIGVSADGALSGGFALSQSLSPKGGALKFGIAKKKKFSALLDLLQTQGQVNVLSSPRIVTLNNTTATINIAEQIPVIGRSIVDSTAGTRTEFEISFQDAGINLEVTPKIGPSGQMIMTVKPKITEQTGTVTTPDGLQTQPILNVRESSNTIKVRDAESIVIGGFIQNRKSEAVTKVPFLGDIPYINPLFRSTDQKIDKVELIIILTPRILTGALNQTMLTESLSRIRRMTRPFGAGILKGNEKEDFARGFLGNPDKHKDPTRIRIEASRLLKAPDDETFRVTRNGMARHYFQKGLEAAEKGLYDRAIEAYETSLFFDPDDGRAYFRLALLYETIGNKAKSRRMAERYLTFGHLYSGELNRLAMSYLQGGDAALSARLLEAALKRDPVNPLLYNNLGIVYRRMKDTDAARQAFMESLNYAPDYPESLYNLALVLEEEREYTEALVYYRRFLALAPFSRGQAFLAVKSRIALLSVYIEEEADASVPKGTALLDRRKGE